MTRSRHLVAALLFLLLAPIAVRAQMPPSFLIERIDVRGARFASESVVARESLLVPGRTYTESQLRHAMSRINRLPFVLDSDFALEKGTERGAYVLVVTIVETKPLFLEAQSTFSKSAGLGGVENQEFVRSGARWFLGSSTLLHASTDFHDGYEAGVTQYNLFGRPGYVTLNVRWLADEPVFTIVDSNTGQTSNFTFDFDPSPELLVGVPVFGNHSIQGRWTYASSSQHHRRHDGTRSDTTRSDQAFALAWVWDTTDDPILPTRGSLWRTEGSLQLSSSDTTSTNLPPFTFSGDTTSLGLGTFFHHHHPLNDRMSVMAGGSIAASRLKFETSLPFLSPQDPVTLWVFSPEAGLTVSLWPERLTRKLGDLRWETRAGYTRHGGAYTAADTLSASTAVVQRNVWGTLRLGFTYTKLYYEELP